MAFMQSNLIAKCWSFIIFRFFAYIILTYVLVMFFIVMVWPLIAFWLSVLVILFSGLLSIFV